MRSFFPSSESFFTVATTVPITRASCISLSYVNSVNHPNYRRVDGRVFHPLRQSCARTSDDQHAFMKAGPDRIHGDHVAAGVRAVDINRANNQQLSALQALVFLRRDDRAQDARDDHARA